MRSVPLQQAYKQAEEYEKTLKLEDFNGYVQVLHEEGTTMFFHHATARKMGPWYCVFPEHHDIHIYHEEDATVCLFEKRVAIEEIDESSFNAEKHKPQDGSDPR